MKHAEIEWENDQACSKQFGNIFFSRLGGLEESTQVFLGLNKLEERFASAAGFQIGELGFGTGLNFILSWMLWLKVAPKGSRLNFVSTELFPMRAEDIRHAHKLWPEILQFSEELIACLPLAIEGTHKLSFCDGRVSLTLLYGDAKETLSQLETVSNKFDCWFLDGFSPQKNPEMWDSRLLEIITGLSKASGTFATYSVAGFLRRNLEKLGWQIEKVPGFAHKRESLRGKLSSVAAQQALQKPSPWFSLNRLNSEPAKTAIVIGAGLAGCWSAYCLARKGIKVRLIEREANVATQASGNLSALAIPYLSLEKNARHRFYVTAFDFCRRELNQLERDEPCLERKLFGASHKLPMEKIKTFASRFESLSIPEELARQSGEEQLFYSNACALNPRLLCQALIESFPEQIEVLLETEALSLESDSGCWIVKTAAQPNLARAEALIIANSYDALKFSQTSWMPLTKVRGEIVLVEDENPKYKLESALCGSSYIIPLTDNKFLIGASYNQVFLDPQPSTEIQEKLFEQSQQEFGLFSEKACILNSRVAFRASTYDRLPYVGPVPDFSKSLEDYKQYRKGYPIRSFPDCSYLPGLFVNLGHGSRGVVSAPLCAEFLAGMLAGEPLPIERDLFPALFPMRWIIRELARGNEVLENRGPEAQF